jgi:hypothetical protein
MQNDSGERFSWISRRFDFFGERIRSPSFGPSPPRPICLPLPLTPAPPNLQRIPAALPALVCARSVEGLEAAPADPAGATCPSGSVYTVLDRAEPTREREEAHDVDALGGPDTGSRRCESGTTTAEQQPGRREADWREGTQWSDEREDSSRIITVARIVNEMEYPKLLLKPKMMRSSLRELHHVGKKEAIV